MINFKNYFLQERLNPDNHAFIEYLLGFLEKELDLVEMNRREGIAKNSGEANVEVRIKPKDLNAEDLPSIDDVFATVAKNANRLKIKGVKINRPSPNSSKFFSVRFDKDDKQFDIVLAQGANRGEKFETDLFDDVTKFLNELKLGTKGNDEVEALFAALKEADPKFKISNIVDFKRRSGATKRKNVDLEDSGAIVGDYVIEMKSPKRTLYVSLKDRSGSTFANLGASGLFDSSFNYNTSHPEYKTLTEIGVDFEEIKKGLKAYDTSRKLNRRESSGGIVRKGSNLYKLLKTGWGKNYIYMRKNKDGFKAFMVDDDLLDNTLLRSLRIEKISYPYYLSDDRTQRSKSTAITLSNGQVKYKIEIRDPSSGVVPKQVNIVLMKMDI